jgi:hypothetical protein
VSLLNAATITSCGSDNRPEDLLSAISGQNLKAKKPLITKQAFNRVMPTAAISYGKQL